MNDLPSVALSVLYCPDGLREPTTMSETLRAHLAQQLEEIRHAGTYKRERILSTPQGTFVRVADGKPVLNLCANNYLGLAQHPEIRAAAHRGLDEWGYGLASVRFICGTQGIHQQLESRLSAFLGMEETILYSSCFDANGGLFETLLGAEDAVISDELNHASIIDGCRLSKAEVKIYPHRDLNHVEDFVRSGRHRRKLVVTESVFSMDGDRAPLKELDAICRRWGAVLMVDEAHATGIIGPEGNGLASELHVVPEIQMGTLGKAVGASGAYVAGRTALIDLLINKARSLIYTTAPPPAVMGAALAALKIIVTEEGAERRRLLKANVSKFNELLASGPWAQPGASHIVPVVIGDSERTMKLSAECLSKGVFAHGIRFPTVPERTARLRFTLMSDHTGEDLRKAVEILIETSAGLRPRGDIGG